MRASLNIGAFAPTVSDVASGADWTGLSDASRVRAELADRDCELVALHRGAWSLFDFGDHGAYAYAAGSNCVHIDRPATDRNMQDLIIEGPLLLHALARHRIVVIHASAWLQSGEQVVALTAPSGTGKSTLAAYAAAQGHTRIADDLLPLIEVDGRVLVVPGMWQPNLTRVEQHRPDGDCELVLTTMLKLERGNSAALSPMAPADVLPTLIDATVASRLYDRDTLVWHLGFCARLAHRVQAGAMAAGTMTVLHSPEAVDEACAAAWRALGAAAIDENVLAIPRRVRTGPPADKAREACEP